VRVNCGLGYSGNGFSGFTFSDHEVLILSPAGFQVVKENLKTLLLMHIAKRFGKEIFCSSFYLIFNQVTQTIPSQKTQAGDNPDFPFQLGSM
jgi:hypothetical protein